MAYSIVQHTSAATNGGNVASLSVSFASNVVAGNRLMLSGAFGADEATTAVSDTRSTSWTKHQSLQYPVSGRWCIVFTGNAPTAGADTVTYSKSSGVDTITLEIVEVSGLAAPTAAEDGIGTATADASTPPTVTMPATTAANELLILFVAASSSNTALPAGTGYTLLDNPRDAGGSPQSADEWKDSGASGTVNTGTIGGTFVTSYALIGVTFKLAAAAAPLRQSAQFMVQAGRPGRGLRRRSSQWYSLTHSSNPTLWQSGSAYTSAMLTSDANWIVSCQLADGAICTYPDKTFIMPYFAHFGAMALAQAYQATRNTTYRDAVWNWLTWYQSKMDATLGYVNDYNVGAGPSFTETVATGAGHPDSTDSYAGLFLVALEWIYNVTGDLTKLQTYSTGVTLALKAIHATQQADGLTWALDAFNGNPAYKVKYLMDQSESYAGLRAGNRLATALGQTTDASNAKTYADNMNTGVQNSLWNASGGYYYSSIDASAGEPGTATATAPATYFYIDSLCQVWAVGLGNWVEWRNPLIPAARALTLCQTFVQNWPRWKTPNDVVAYNPPPDQAVGYRAPAGWGLWSVGLWDEARAGLTSIRDVGVNVNARAYPFTVDSQGEILTLGLLVQEAPSQPTTLSLALGLRNRALRRRAGQAHRASSETQTVFQSQVISQDASRSWRQWLLSFRNREQSAASFLALLGIVAASVGDVFVVQLVPRVRRGIRRGFRAFQPARPEV